MADIAAWQAVRLVAALAARHTRVRPIMAAIVGVIAHLPVMPALPREEAITAVALLLVAGITAVVLLRVEVVSTAVVVVMPVVVADIAKRLVCC